MYGMVELYGIANRVRAGERAAMRRWLAMHESEVALLRNLEAGVLEKAILAKGGDPEKVRAFGRELVVLSISKQAGWDGD